MSGEFEAWAQGVGLELGGDQIRQFEGFEERLYEANQVMNLTRVPREECWVRHFVDSLLFQDLIPQGARVLDIGTGPGFPAWPLACARPDLSVVGLDGNAKMLGFLSEQQLPNLEVIKIRAEDFAERETFDVVTGRAVAPLPIQLELSTAPCRVGGVIVLMRTPQDDLQSANWQTLGLRPGGVYRRTLPVTGAERVFPVYAKETPTSKRYPRRWAEIKANPLAVAR